VEGIAHNDFDQRKTRSAVRGFHLGEIVAQKDVDGG
jgi:hypothetical protein